MSTDRHAPRRPRHSLTARQRGCLAVAAAVAGIVLAAVPVAAHDELVSVTPAEGSVVTSPPTTVVLVFTDEIQPLGTGVVVRGADGSVLSSGPCAVSGRSLTQPLTPLTSDGDYVVSYRVVSADGHPVTGETTFAARGIGPAMTPAASLTSGVRNGSASGGHSIGPPGWALLGGLLLAATALGVRARRRVPS